MTRFQPVFPSYSDAERRIDQSVHVAGLTAALAAILWLLGHFGPQASAKQVTSVIVYSLGLLGMLVASALYNLAQPGRLKAVLRRLDHSMIYVMIAGTYTPFSLLALERGLGVPLCTAEWVLALSGVTITLAVPQWQERISLALYLIMGWLVLPVLWPLAARMPTAGFVLLLVGGLVYSLGSFVQTRTRWPFHNPIWHTLVCLAAALHLGAVAQVVFWRV